MKFEMTRSQVYFRCMRVDVVFGLTSCKSKGLLDAMEVIGSKW